MTPEAIRARIRVDYYNGGPDGWRELANDLGGLVPCIPGARREPMFTLIVEALGGSVTGGTTSDDYLRVVLGVYTAMRSGFGYGPAMEHDP